MIEPRESPDEAAEARTSVHRRFARLVESPVGRRLAPRRLVLAVLASLGFVIGAVFLCFWVKDAIKGWVDARPEYQLPFAEIKLEPEPPEYIRPGRAGLLEQIRVASGLPERVGVLPLDAEQLIAQFRRSPWVQDVIKVDRPYRGLTVHLVYRRPVAVAEFARVEGSSAPDQEVIDRSGVILPGDDIKRTGYQIRGLAEPLVAIRDISAPFEPVAGRQWRRKRADGTIEDPDLEVLGAARLAEFLRTRPTRTPAGREMPRILSISFNKKRVMGYFLLVTENQWIWWRSTPGAEALDEPGAVDKWTMLMKKVDETGKLRIEEGYYLKFTLSKTEVAKFAPRTGP